MGRRLHSTQALAGVAVLLMSACGGKDASITGPEPLAGPKASATIGPSGGEVGYDDGRFKLTIPPGALGNDTEIVITEISGEDIPEELRDPSVLKVYDLQPDGLKFETPATAEVRTDGSPAPPDGAPLVGLISDSQGSLELLGPLEQTVDSTGITSSAPISHFSEVANFEFQDFTVSVTVSPQQLPVGAAFQLTFEAEQTSKESPAQAVVDLDITAIPAGVVSLPTSFDPPGFALTPGVTQSVERTVTGTCMQEGGARVEVEAYSTSLLTLFQGLNSGSGFAYADAKQAIETIDTQVWCTPAAPSLAGTVTVDGQPTGGIEVTVAGVVADTAKTGADGRYSFEELPPGDYDVMVGCPSGTVPDASPKGATVRWGQTETVDFACTSGSIAGTVTVDGQPTGGIVVIASGVVAFSSVTAADGTYSIPALPPGDYDVSVGCPSGTTPDASPKGATVTSGQETTVDFACTTPPPSASFTVPLGLHPSPVSGPVDVDVAGPTFANLAGEFVVAILGNGGYAAVDLASDDVLRLVTGRAAPFGGTIATWDPPGSTSPAVFFGANTGSTGFESFLDNYDPATGAYTAQSLPGLVDDVTRAGGELASEELVYVEEDGIHFVHFDPIQGVYLPTSEVIPAAGFGGGVPASAVEATAGGPLLVVTQDARLFLDRRDGSNPVVIGTIGADALKMRCLDQTCAVTSLSGDAVQILTWDGVSGPTTGPNVSTGSGPVTAGFFPLPNGRMLIGTPNVKDDSFTMIVWDSSGRVVVSSATRPVDAGCQSPSGIQFFRDSEGIKALIACGQTTTSENHLAVTDVNAFATIAP